MRNQLTEIIEYHQNEIKEAQKEINFCNKVIVKIDTPLILPDVKDELLRQVKERLTNG